MRGAVHAGRKGRVPNTQTHTARPVDYNTLEFPECVQASDRPASLLSSGILDFKQLCMGSLGKPRRISATVPSLRDISMLKQATCLLLRPA